MSSRFIQSISCIQKYRLRNINYRISNLYYQTLFRFKKKKKKKKKKKQKKKTTKNEKIINFIIIITKQYTR